MKLLGMYKSPDVSLGLPGGLVYSCLGLLLVEGYVAPRRLLQVQPVVLHVVHLGHSKKPSASFLKKLYNTQWFAGQFTSDPRGHFGKEREILEFSPAWYPPVFSVIKYTNENEQILTKKCTEYFLSKCHIKNDNITWKYKW
jgi:hypothetical protein